MSGFHLLDSLGVAVVRMPPRVGLIGISGYARLYLDEALALHDAGQICLTAVVVINPQETSAALSDLKGRQIAIFEDYRSMLDVHRGRLELCLVPTGIPWHARMTIAALEAGANVLVEKPLAGSMQDVAAIRAAEHAAGCFVAVGFQDIYQPGAAWLRGELQRGQIGQVRSLRILGIWPRTHQYYQRNDWAGRLSLGGVNVLDSPLNNGFAHYVNLSLYLLARDRAPPQPVDIQTAELLRTQDIESFDTAMLKGVMSGDVRFWIGVSHACAERHDPRIVIEGTCGRATWSHESCITLTSAGQPEQKTTLSSNDASRSLMFAAVIKRLRDPTVPICGTDIAAAHTTFVEQVHRVGVIRSQLRPSAGLPPADTNDPSMHQDLTEILLARFNEAV